VNGEVDVARKFFFHKGQSQIEGDDFLLKLRAFQLDPDEWV
jgi:hypothetical protein